MYSPESNVRKTGSYIYEEFMPTDGTDVKVWPCNCALQGCCLWISYTVSNIGISSSFFWTVFTGKKCVFVPTEDILNNGLRVLCASRIEFPLHINQLLDA